MIGTCVQIGLHTSAEYLYLTDNCWREKMLCVDVLHHIPEAICNGIDQWNYFGIDEDPHSIAYIHELHGDKGVWLNAHVSGSSERVASAYHEGPEHTHSLLWQTGKTFTTHAIAITLSELFRVLGLGRIDVLAMDIEGMEFGVFRDYDWKIKPRFIAVEIHSYKPIQQDVENILEGQGYRLNSMTPTNIGNTYPTMEAKYIYAP